MVIALDRWLKADDARGPGLDGRFDVDGMLEAFRAARARSGGPVELTGLPLFSLVERRPMDGAPPIALKPETIVIWEGVCAQGLAERSGEPARCVYVDTDEDRRRQRVVGEYVRRGRDHAAASGVYESRLADEIEPVMAGKTRATAVVTLDPCFADASAR